MPVPNRRLWHHSRGARADLLYLQLADRASVAVRMEAVIIPADLGLYAGRPFLLSLQRQPYELASCMILQ